MDALGDLPLFLAIVIGIGYFCGSLFRQPGLWKIILIFAIALPLIGFAISINDIAYVTGPFLLGGGLGFYGPEKIKRGLMTAGDHLHEFRHRKR